MGPVRQFRGALLPWEKQLIDALHLTEAEYSWYANEVANYKPPRDAAYDAIPDVVCAPLAIPIAVAVVGAGVSYAAQALAPKPKLPKASDPAQTAAQEAGPNVTGGSVNAENRFRNIDGFTSVQPLARLGETMPLVFANRQTFSGTAYGGVRVETKLIWSQLLSMGNSQELLALFLAGNGTLLTRPDFEGIAIGDSLLRGYQTSKLALYFQSGAPGEGRITEVDKIIGDLKSRSLDVFQTEYSSVGMQSLFSGIRIPTTMTQFGSSEPMRNAQAWRLPYKQVRVTYPTLAISAYTQQGYSEAVSAFEKAQAAADRATEERKKVTYSYGCRTGILKVGSQTVSSGYGYRDVYANIGEVIEFLIFSGNTSNVFRELDTNDIDTKDNNYRQSCDDTIIVGESYLIGGAEAKCTGSNLDSDLWDINKAKVYYFEVVLPGTVRIVSADISIPTPWDSYRDAIQGRTNPSYGLTITRLTSAHITTTRKLDQIEIGLKSQVWKRFTGIANFSSIPEGGVIDKIEQAGGTFQVGSYSDYGLRYSFFRLEIRAKGAKDWFNLIPGPGSIFCVKGRTPIDQFNFIRIAFSQTDVQYEVRCRPVAGGAYLQAQWPLSHFPCILDARTGGIKSFSTSSSQYGTFTVSYKGFNNEEITEITATNEVMFSSGKPTSGAVQSLVQQGIISTQDISGVYNASTNNGNGSGLTVSVSSQLQTDFRSEEDIQYKYDDNSEYTLPANIKAFVIKGMQNRWLHEYIMGYAPPQSIGASQLSRDVTFTDVQNRRDGSGVPYTVTVRLTLTPVAVDAFWVSAGYNNSQFAWRNLANTPFEVTVVRWTGVQLPSGPYVVNKPSNAPTPFYNGENQVQSSIDVVAAGRDIWYSTVTVASAGQNYNIGDYVNLVNTPIVLYNLRVKEIQQGDISKIADRWDAIADVYNYDEQEGSHERGPEHQIVYINEQRKNYKLTSAGVKEFAPQYDNMALLGLQLRSGKEWSSFNNLTYYAKQGRNVVRMVDPASGDTSGYTTSTLVKGPSHLFPEILRELLRSDTTGASKLVPESMIDWPGFQEACKVCIANKWFWDGVISSPVNIREWAHENSAYFFLDFLILGGKISLQPTFPVDPTQGLRGYELAGAYQRIPKISALFTDGNIIENSLQVSWYPAEQRLAPQVLVTVRDEVENGFSETRNILVRLATSLDANAASAPVEAVDFTGFCTSAKHAIEFAKLLINTRRFTTHTVTFKTFPNGLQLAPGAYFKLSSQARHTDRFQNGYVLADGTVVSSSEINASNLVYWWRPGMTEVMSGTMAVDLNTGKVTDNKFAEAVFTVYTVDNFARAYKAELISYDEEGMVEITGTQMLQKDTGAFWYLDLDDAQFEVQTEQ